MSIATAFKSLHYQVDVITQCVRWYLAYSLSAYLSTHRRTPRLVAKLVKQSIKITTKGRTAVLTVE